MGLSTTVITLENQLKEAVAVIEYYASLDAYDWDGSVSGLVDNSDLFRIY